MASIAGWVTLVATSIVVVVAFFVAMKARKTIPEGYSAIYTVRPYYAGALVVGLVFVLAASLSQTPYSPLPPSEQPIRVDVTGRMWSWQIRRADESPGSVSSLVLPAGKVVEFAVTSEDVNHGFALYDESGRLLAQTQAMPGYVNRLRYVFESPGRYHVACLEYCGLAHHAMLAEIAVQ